MNLSMQIGRAIFATSLGAVAAVCAFAQTDSEPEAPAVAHNRLEIAPANEPAAKEAPRWVVASVRVGAPLAAPRERARVATRDHAPLMPRS